MAKGFTLTEVIVAMVISIIALFGIETLIAESYRQWKSSQKIVNLFRDLDVASYSVKGVLEEANPDTNLMILDGGTKIVASYKNLWQKEFYSAANNRLVLKNNKTGDTYDVINSLDAVLFEQTSSDTARVKVTLNVKKEGESLQHSFYVYLRNKGGG